MPAAPDELGEVAAVAVDAGRIRRGCVLVHAQQTAGPNWLLWLDPVPMRRVAAERESSRMPSGGGGSPAATSVQ